ncbi:MAG TPA: hypothetical protein PLZ84_08005, partial [Clostridia bacterium]|nr:hypothetical protein [Clostridia bacterium]
MIRKLLPSSIIWVIGYVLITVLLLIAITPRRYNLQVGQISNELIIATRQVVDTYSTELAREEAARNVELVYKRDDEKTQSVLSEIESDIDDVEAVRVLIYNEITRLIAENIVEGTITYNDISDSFLKEQIEKLDFSSNIKLLEDIYRASGQDIRNMRTLLGSIAKARMDAGIIDLNEALNELNSRISTDITISSNAKAIAVAIISYNLTTNMSVDEEATENQRQKARNAVLPIVYEKGEKIIGEGERVERKHVEVLKALGLHKDKPYDIPLYIGVAALILLMMALVYLFILFAEKNMVSNPKLILMYILIVIINIALTLLLKPVNLYLSQATFAVIM